MAKLNPFRKKTPSQDLWRELVLAYLDSRQTVDFLSSKRYDPIEELNGHYGGAWFADQFKTRDSGKFPYKYPEIKKQGDLATFYFVGRKNPIIPILRVRDIGKFEEKVTVNVNFRGQPLDVRNFMPGLQEYHSESERKRISPTLRSGVTNLEKRLEVLIEFCDRRARDYSLYAPLVGLNNSIDNSIFEGILTNMTSYSALCGLDQEHPPAFEAEIDLNFLRGQLNHPLYYNLARFDLGIIPRRNDLPPISKKFCQVFNRFYSVFDEITKLSDIGVDDLGQSHFHLPFESRPTKAKEGSIPIGLNAFALLTYYLSPNPKPTGLVLSL